MGPEAAGGPGGLMPDPAIRAYYERGEEDGRLRAARGRLEFLRTQEIVRRHLPRAPARVLDVGGGSGIHAAWLAADGHRVHLVDPVELHVEQARAAAGAQPEAPFTAATGDARALAEADGSVDSVLLLGPLYHLTERADRVAALAEARRVLRPGGVAFGAAISRFASLFDGLAKGFLAEAAFRTALERTLRDGQHRNPTGPATWFTTAYFHRPDELRDEVGDAGLELVELVAVESVGWLAGRERWEDPGWRELVLEACRLVEAEPALLASGGHLIAVARRP
jgi:ubiquinone/menaquinone biosynthesis C-methylase UbiE